MTTTQTTEATTSEIVEAMRKAHAAGDTDTLSSLIDILAGRGVEGDEALVAIFDELRTTEEDTMEQIPADTLSAMKLTLELAQDAIASGEKTLDDFRDTHALVGPDPEAFVENGRLGVWAANPDGATEAEVAEGFTIWA